MTLNLATIKTLFRTELRMALRDRRMLVTSVLLPMLITPLMFLGSMWGVKKHEKKLQEMVYPYAVSGSKAAFVRTLLAGSRGRLDAAADTNKTVFRFREVTCQEPMTALNKGDIQFWLEGLSVDEALDSRGLGEPAKKSADDRAKDQSEAEDDDQETPLNGAPVIRIVFRADRHESAAGMSKMREELNRTRRVERFELLRSHGFELRPAEVAAIKERDVASTAQVAGLSLGRTITVLLLLFILSSGAVVAIDSLAGEKERGTLETLLTTSAGRAEILAAKQLVIIAVALVITAIQLLNFLAYIHFKLIPVPVNWAAAITPPVAILLFILYVPLAALSASVLLLVSGLARGYKEAQMWFMPVLLVALVPALAPCLPGLSLRSLIALVPIANIALAAKEILIGSFDWPMILVSWLTTAAAAVWTTRFGLRSLAQEKLITAAETDAVDLAGGPALFERRVWRWFAALWGLLLMVSSFTEKLDLRLQVVINLVGLFFGASCLMMRCYRLDPREALALRLPRPAVWLGLLPAIPGGFLTAIGCFHLSNFIIPSPSHVVENFSESVLPENIPLFQLLLMLTVLPGVFEEITFRGMLLHGLRRRFSPAGVALVVGVVFGLFHVALFRLVPTACLGIMFAGVTLLTGSIFPAMIWHASSNMLGVLASRFRFPENDLDSSCYLLGAGLLAIAFWIFWRNRTLYPGLRSTPRR